MNVLKNTILGLLMGAAIGTSCTIVAYSYSLQAHHMVFSVHNWLLLHTLYPFHYFIDALPFATAAIFYANSLKSATELQYGIKLRGLIEQKTNDLKESNKKLKAIFNSSGDINVLIGLDKRVVAFNRAATAFMVDISGEQFLVIGDDIFNHVSDVAQDGFAISFDIAAKGKKIQFIENFRLFKSTIDKKLIWLFIELQPVMDDDGIIEAVSMNITDITKRKEIESAIRQQNKQLKKIAWIQSHQIRKPVANILGLIPLFDRNQLQQEDQKLLEHLKISTAELDSYIREIVKETKPIDADN